MAETNLLANEMRYFGLESPRGNRWYNFETDGYLECATCGYFGGWSEGDLSDRICVPGEAAFIDEDSSIQSEDPEGFQTAIANLNDLSWNQVSDFLYCGQIYE